MNLICIFPKSRSFPTNLGSLEQFKGFKSKLKPWKNKIANHFAHHRGAHRDCWTGSSVRHAGSVPQPTGSLAMKLAHTARAIEASIG
jgi:hypothetical protein